MPAKKKPTMKQLEEVINNLIHDVRIVNQKADASFWGLKNFVKFSGKEEDFNKFLKEIKEKADKEKAEKEKNERAESDKASTETDSSKSTKG